MPSIAEILTPYHQQTKTILLGNIPAKVRFGKYIVVAYSNGSMEHHIQSVSSILHNNLSKEEACIERGPSHVRVKLKTGKCSIVKFVSITKPQDSCKLRGVSIDYLVLI